MDDSLELDFDAADDLDDEVPFRRDVDRLFAKWRNEKYAPELLPFDSKLVEDFSEVIEFVGENLESEREDPHEDSNSPDYRLRSIEHERMKYLLKDYLRIRLWKLSQWSQHYLEPEKSHFLSDAERTFVRELWGTKKSFFEHLFVTALPVSKQKLDDKFDVLEMVRRPKLDQHVYARIVGNIGAISVPPSLTQNSSGEPVSQQSLETGQTYLLRYSLVRKFLIDPEHEGKVELV